MARNLTDEDVEAVAQRVVSLLAERIAAPPPQKVEAPTAVMLEAAASKPTKLTFTLKEVCEELNMSPASIYRLTARGLLKAIPGHRRKIYTRKAVERFLAGEAASMKI